MFVWFINLKRIYRNVTNCGFYWWGIWSFSLRFTGWLCFRTLYVDSPILNNAYALLVAKWSFFSNLGEIQINWNVDWPWRLNSEHAAGSWAWTECEAGGERALVQYTYYWNIYKENSCGEIKPSFSDVRDMISWSHVQTLSWDSWHLEEVTMWFPRISVR